MQRSNRLQGMGGGKVEEVLDDKQGIRAQDAVAVVTDTEVEPAISLHAILKIGGN